MLNVDVISLEMSPLLQQLISSSSAQGPASEVAETNNNFAAAASGEGGVSVECRAEVRAEVRGAQGRHSNHFRSFRYFILLSQSKAGMSHE